MEQSIKEYIEEHYEDLKDKLYPLFTTDISSLCATYAFTDISADHINESQLELRIIWNDYDQCVEVANKVRDVLAMESDEPFINYGAIRFHSELMSGGGFIFNEEIQMYEVVRYYKIDWRKRNNEKR